jgi:hypothetical protein
MPIPGITGIAGFGGAGAGGGGGGSAIGSGSSQANAFDNNTGTAWSPAGSTGQIGWDFGGGNEKAIVEVAITTSGSTTLAALPKDFTLQWSDDNSSWTTQDTIAAYGWLFSHTRAFPETAPAAGFHRFWRIFSEVNNDLSAATGLDDVQFRATAGGADQSDVLTSSNGGATGRSTASHNSAQSHKAFDSNLTGGDPLIMGSATNVWVAYIFPSPVEVQEVLVKIYSHTGRSPNIIRIEYSDDEVTWTSQKRITGLTWTANESKVLTAI